MFIEELKKEYRRLVVIEMSMLKRRIALDNAWSGFRAELEKAERDSSVSDEEMAKLYDKNDKFNRVCDIASDREYHIELLLKSMAEVIDRYNWGGKNGMDFVNKYAEWCEIMDALDSIGNKRLEIRATLEKAAKAIEEELKILHEGD